MTKKSWEDGMTPEEIKELDLITEQIKKNFAAAEKAISEGIEQGEALPEFMNEIVADHLARHKKLN